MEEIKAPTTQLDITKVESIQNFTESDISEFFENSLVYIKGSKENASNALKILNVLLNETYEKKLGFDDAILNLCYACYKVLEQPWEKYLRNSTYERNHGDISAFIHNTILDYGRFPNVSMIASETGLSRMTVHKHLKDGFDHKFNELLNGKIQYMIPKALEKLYLIGVENNNSHALKNFIELSGYKKPNNTTEINNYIQINNLKLSKEELEKLPHETILELENIISKAIIKK
ncbi:hypothetical protein N1F78_11570 [Seonamhaeicola sp. MEBiC1930]|uniref:hypothetical protein n=1 Tax=Seonamhaeicola sp. MEBiC01930 TaxID=2976768 RepID=UPI0032566133